MRKRYYSIVILSVALLLSTWGNVIAASFCSRFALNRDCHFQPVAYQPKQAVHQPSCHEEMGDSDMREMQMDAAPDSARDSDIEVSPIKFTFKVTSDRLALELPIEPCPHCVSHSRPASGATSAAVAVDPSKRLVEADAAPANFVATPLSAIQAIVPMEHGPPGQSSHRHLLISVFRI